MIHSRHPGCFCDEGYIGIRCEIAAATTVNTIEDSGVYQENEAKFIADSYGVENAALVDAGSEFIDIIQNTININIRNSRRDPHSATPRRLLLP